MNTLTVELNLPRDLLGALEVPEGKLGDRIRELIALELFREGRISAGKGAELVGVSKLAFIQRLAQHNIPYFTESSQELVTEVNIVEQLLDENRG